MYISSLRQINNQYIQWNNQVDKYFRCMDEIITWKNSHLQKTKPNIHKDESLIPLNHVDQMFSSVIW